jgi:hypothetical protein
VALATGTRLGPYEVQAPLGAGAARKPGVDLKNASMRRWRAQIDDPGILVGPEVNGFTQMLPNP